MQNLKALSAIVTPFSLSVTLFRIKKAVIKFRHFNSLSNGSRISINSESNSKPKNTNFVVGNTVLSPFIGFGHI
jgi:hypothetical protein